MLVGCIDICSKVQKALQAGHALRLLTGQVQGAALMDLSQESTARLAWEPGGLLTTPDCIPPSERLDLALTRSLRLMSAPWRTNSSTMSGWFRRTAMCRAV